MLHLGFFVDVAEGVLAAREVHEGTLVEQTPIPRLQIARIFRVFCSGAKLRARFGNIRVDIFQTEDFQ